jgi:hypothetical protein
MVIGFGRRKHGIKLLHARCNNLLKENGNEWERGEKGCFF